MIPDSGAHIDTYDELHHTLLAIISLSSESLHQRIRVHQVIGVCGAAETDVGGTLSTPRLLHAPDSGSSTFTLIPTLVELFN